MSYKKYIEAVIPMFKNVLIEGVVSKKTPTSYL